MADFDWANSTEKSFILKNTIHIWKITYSDFDNEESGFGKILSKQEISRADKFYFSIDKKRYLLTRALLKNILARITGADPQKLHFKFNEHGKPHLENFKHIYFNISHSADIGLIAVTDCAAIGIDVEEYRKRLQLQEISKRFFSRYETDVLSKLPDNQKMHAFFNCWTRKEAFIKALGLGLTLPLKHFDVTLHPAEQARVIAIRYKDEKAEEWTLKDIPMENEYAAAFAVKFKNFKDYYWIAKDLA
jgi:4'-phosphopantetheinyl transferase